MVNYTLSFYDLNPTKTRFHYVVIVSLHKGNQVWLRKHNSATWEVPGGHVEVDETPEMAARRELWEETGAIDFSLKPVCDFAIKNNGKQSYNRLFFADITTFGPLPNFEIGEMAFFETPPSTLTHGLIQLELTERVFFQLGIHKDK